MTFSPLRLFSSSTSASFYEKNNRAAKTTDPSNLSLLSLSPTKSKSRTTYDPPGAVVTKPMFRYDFSLLEKKVEKRLQQGDSVCYTLNDYETDSVDDGANGKINIFKLMADARPLLKRQRDILSTKYNLLPQGLFELDNHFDARIYQRLAKECAPLEAGHKINLQEILTDAKVN